MSRVGVLHKCSAFRHRIEARLDDRLALPRLQIAKREGGDHYRGWACALLGKNPFDLRCLTPDDSCAWKPPLKPPAHLQVLFDEHQVLLSDPHARSAPW